VAGFVFSRSEPSIIVIGGNWSNAGEISTLVEKLLESNKTVILIMPLLNIGFDVPQRWMENQARAGRPVEEWKLKADPSLTMTRLRSEITERLSRHKGDPRLILVDPSSVICEQSECYLVRNGQSNFRDSAHISNVNSMQYEALFNAAFQEAVNIDRKKPD
jgi:hypothetical protein